MLWKIINLDLQPASPNVLKFNKSKNFENQIRLERYCFLYCFWTWGNCLSVDSTLVIGLSGALVEIVKESS